MDNIFEGRTKQLKKLKKIEDDFGKLEAIREYETSKRAVV